MASQFAWVDFAADDRNRMLTVVRLFREQDTRDELGIGTIRDAFADFFFPGTSTIQTRIRYMLFVPWLYQTLSARSTPRSAIAERARKLELRLIGALLNGGEKEGVIGRRARARLQRLPSNIYWNGLGEWGIRCHADLSQETFHRLWNPAPAENATPIWDPGLPSVPAGLLDETTFALTSDEARYLEDRLHFSCPQSLLTQLVGVPYQSTDFLWEHPLATNVSPALQANIRHARNFSETMLGATLTYNYLLAKKSNLPDLIDEYRQRLHTWSERITARHADLHHWQQRIADFWKVDALHTAHLSPSTRTFVERWLELVFEDTSPPTVADRPDAAQLLHRREVRLKGQRARLENPRALERWTGHAGDRPLDFRWHIALGMAADIQRALQAGGASHA